MCFLPLIISSSSSAALTTPILQYLAKDVLPWVAFIITDKVPAVFVSEAVLTHHYTLYDWTMILSRGGLLPWTIVFSPPSSLASASQILSILTTKRIAKTNHLNPNNTFHRNLVHLHLSIWHMLAIFTVVNIFWHDVCTIAYDVPVNSYTMRIKIDW